MSNNTKQRKSLAMFLIVALLITTMQPLFTEVAYGGKNDKLAWDQYKVSKDGKTVYIDPDDYEGETLQDRQDKAGEAFIVALRDIQTRNGDAKNADTILIQGDICVDEGQNQNTWNPTAASISVTIKGDGKPTIWVENYHNYFLRGYRSNITLENLVIDGSGNTRLMQGGCLYGEDAKFTLKNVTIQNFTKLGAYDDGLSAPDGYGDRGEGIYGGAAVMLFTESFSGDTASQTPYSSFKMDANSKILNCHSYEAGGDASVDYDFGAIGGAVYLEGLALNYPMEVELNGEINGGNGSAVYAKWCDISMGNNAYIHNAEGKYGGAIQLSGSGLTMNGSKIENCTGTYGGAIYVDAGEQRNVLKGASTTTQMKVISLNSGTIQNCTAKQGGAVYAEKYKTKVGSSYDKENVMFDEYDYYLFDHPSDYPYITFGDMNLYNNSAEEGGAIYNNRSYLEIKGGNISGNTASKDGGAVYKTKKASVILSGGVFENNAAEGKGQDIYAITISNLYGYSYANDKDEEKYAQNQREFLYVKGSPKISTPIHINNAEEKSAENNASPVQVLGRVTETLKFDFEAMGKDNGTEHDPLILGCGTKYDGCTDKRNNNPGYLPEKYDITYDDFMNLIIAQIDSYAVSYNGGRSDGEYGAYFPGLFSVDDKIEGCAYTYNSISAIDKAPVSEKYGCDRPASEIIYISSNGNDSTGDGSKENPLKTYNKARQLMKNKITLTEKDKDGGWHVTGIYYINSIASLTPLTPEMGVPDNMKDMVWYSVDHPGASINEVPGDLAREGKELTFEVKWPDGYELHDNSKNDVTWMVLKGDMPRSRTTTDFKGTNYIGIMPAEPVMILADTGQVEYIKSMDVKLDLPDPDRVKETSYVTIQSMTVANCKGVNERTITDKETITSTLGGTTVPVEWKKVEAGTQGFTEDEPFAVFDLNTGFIQNGGNGFAIAEDVVIKVNGKTTDITVNNFDDVTASHHVDKSKIPELPAPTVTLNGETSIDVTKAGTIRPITAEISGVYEFTKPVNWEIVEVNDPDNILTLPKEGKGVLPAGKNIDMSFGDITVAPNPIGHGAKSATVKIKFSKEKGIVNYQGLPAEITLTYHLEKGDKLPQVDAAIDFTKETIEVNKAGDLKDYAIEYMIVKEGDYRSGLWNISGNKLSLKETSLDIADYIFTKDHGTRYAVYMRYVALAEDPGPGEVKELVIPERPDAPTVSINYQAEITVDTIHDGMVYGTAEDSLTETGIGSAVTLTPGVDMYFQLKPTESAFASVIQHLAVKERPAAPSNPGINYMAETTGNAIANTVVYGTSKDEVCKESLVGTGAPVPVTPGTNMYFATKSTQSEFRSDIVMLEVPARPAKTTFTVNYAAEKTAEAIPSTVQYGISADAMHTAGLGEKLTLTPGTDVYFFKPATGTTFKTETQHLVVKPRRGAPDVKAVNEDVWGEGDGKIKGLEAEADYRMQQSNGQWGEWKNNGNANTIKNLTSGTYQVRYVATSTDFTSDIRIIDVDYDRTITVKFNSKKGTNISDQTGLKYDSKVTKPADPQKKNCDFVAWCEDLLLLNQWNFDKDTVKDDLTLYAKWKRNKMDTPEDLKWNKNTAKWDSVDDEDEYTVKLYKAGSHVETVTTNKNSYDMNDLLKKHGSGDYTFTVVAVSTGLFGSGIKDSDVANSPTRTYYRAPDITKEPADYETTVSVKAEFVAGAVVDRNEALSYQWQRSEKGKDKWKNIDGATGTTYTIKEATLDDGNYIYRCQVQDQKDNEIYTREATLVVNKKPEVTISVSENPVEKMKDVVLTANVSYGTGKMTYKWTDEDGSTTDKLTLNLKETAKLKVTVTDERGVTASANVTVQVKKSQAEIVYEQFTSLDDQLGKASKTDRTSGHVYYLMKSAVEGYEDLSASQKAALDLLDPDNDLDKLYKKYKPVLEKADAFTDKVDAVAKGPFTPETKADVDILSREMEELQEDGIPVSTSITDENTGTMPKLKSMVENTRNVETLIRTLVKDILSQMSDEDLAVFKEQMKEYIGEIPEVEKIPGLGTYIKQLFSGEAKMDIFSYIKACFEDESSAEMRAFKEAVLDYIAKSENKEAAISYVCETLVNAYQPKNESAIKEASWSYYALCADEQNMVAPALKAVLTSLYDKMMSDKDNDAAAAVSFEKQVESVEANPTIDGISNLEDTYGKLSDNQKALLSTDLVSRYETLVADKNAAVDVASKLLSFDATKLNRLLSGKDGQTIDEFVADYQNLSVEQKALIKDALGRRADNVINTIEVVKKINGLDKNTMAEDAYWDEVAEIVKAVNRLPEKARELLKEAYLNHNPQAAAEFESWKSDHRIACKTSTPTTDIEVIGVTKKTLKDIADDQNITEVVLQAEDTGSVQTSADVSGKQTIVSVDARLMISVANYDGSYRMDDAELKEPVQVKIHIPNNYQTESLELWNITRDGKLKYVEDAIFVWEGNELYVVFDTKTFGQFIVYAKDITTTADLYIGDLKVTEKIDAIEVDTYYDSEQEVRVEVRDNGLGAEKVQYYVSSSILNTDALQRVSQWTDYTKPIKLAANKTHVVYVKMIDEVGNVTYATSRGILIDNIAPTITGITNRNYCVSPTMTVKDTNLKTTKMDGKIINLSNGQYSIPEGTHEIVATDILGNSTKVTVTVFDGHKPSAWQDIDSKTHRKYCEGCGAEVNNEKHKYNQKVVASKHLKNAATYNKEGTYYKSCVCGRTDDTAIKGTFKGGGLKYDGVAPSVSISIQKETKKKITYKVSVSDGESGIDKKYHYDAGAPMDAAGVKAISWWDKFSGNTFSIKKDKTKAVYVKAEDEQGNYTIIDQNGRVVVQYIH